MEYVAEIAVFAAKALLIFGGVLVILVIVIAQLSAGSRRQHPQMRIEKLNERYRSLRRQLQSHLQEKKQYKALVKTEKKATKKQTPREDRVFVLDFHGDIRASATASLREEVTALLSVARPGDEVVVRLESGGGLVTSYGLAAAQLARFRAKGVRLTVCVDRIAASGGYMMACVADRILAAPFAVLGSIGVIAQVPNFHKVLEKHDIDYREVTAGEFKRTVSVFGEITQPGFAKFKAQIEDTHRLFKAFVVNHRPRVDIDRVATGEHWYGSQALEVGLVDSILTSDEYLQSFTETADVFRISFQGRKKLMERFSDNVARTGENVFLRVWSHFENRIHGA